MFDSSKGSRIPLRDKDFLKIRNPSTGCTVSAATPADLEPYSSFSLPQWTDTHAVRTIVGLRHQHVPADSCTNHDR